MKPLTMTEEDEREVRDRCAGVMPLGWTGAARDCQSAWAEVDALRAKLAEVEAREAVSRAACESIAEAFAPDADFVTLADRLKAKFAASQAEARALREALEKFKWAAAPDKHRGVSAYPYEEISDLLATPPGDDAALREVCRRVARRIGHGVHGHGHFGCCATKNMQNTFEAEVERVVRRELGSPHTGDRFDCPECGQGVEADEDGLCAMCGADCLTVFGPKATDASEGGNG